MTSNIKPYRLINATELNHLQQLVDENLARWNDKYALNPLSGKLKKSQAPQMEPCIVVKDNYRDFAMVSHDHLSIIKHSIIGHLDDCFNGVAEIVLLTLLTQLLAKESLSLQENPNIKLQDWFYIGAPSLTLTLSTNNKSHELTLYLHPDWVLSALPSNKIIKEGPVKLDEAIANQSMLMHVALNPVSLKLNDILNLRVGDVLKTDHAITTPLRLRHQNQIICDVAIGKNKTHQSIQITRES